MDRILIVGGTGYLGQYITRASLSSGHPTYLFVRPSTAEAAAASPNSPRAKLLHEFEALGVHILQGYLEDEESILKAVRQVDIVISTVAVPQHMDQLNIIKAIKQAGTIKRFVPSEFGNEVDRITALPPLERVFDNKRKIRRAVEEANIPHTFISANSFSAYFVDLFLHPGQSPPAEEVTIYGDGLTKAVLNLEDDIAAYTIKVVNDPRTLNRVIIYRPPGNIICQSELISLWEHICGRTLSKTFLPERDVVRLTETLEHPDNIPPAILHNIFIKGYQTSFDLGEEDLEASELYAEYSYAPIREFLRICALHPRVAKRASFA